MVKEPAARLRLGWTGLGGGGLVRGSGWPGVVCWGEVGLAEVGCSGVVRDEVDDCGLLRRSS